jgi:hypothetical protein
MPLCGKSSANFLQQPPSSLQKITIFPCMCLEPSL